MDLRQLPLSNVRAVLSDLDDTLTDESLIRPEAYSALWELKRKGYWLAIISGRPAGWADCLMRLWPLDAMVFENGAGLMLRRGKKIETVTLASGVTLAEQRHRLQGLFETLRAEIPTLKLASDQPYRLCDYAIDYAEEPPFLSEDQVSAIMGHLSHTAGITAKLSSIHVNYWCGTHTKVTACERLMASELAPLGIGKNEIVYCGDSPNDEPLFEFFPHSVGVANVKKFLSRMKTHPRYIARSEGGAGFVELVDILPARMV